MNVEDYFQEVWSRLPKIEDTSDIDIVNDMIRECYIEEWTIQDATKMIKLTEHVSPHLSERYACEKIGEITRKYRKGKPKCE